MQSVLTEQVGLTTSTLSRIERGAQGASLEALVRIAKALGVTHAHLVDFEGEREIPQDAIDGVLAALPGEAGVLRRRIMAAVKVLLRGD